MTKWSIADKLSVIMLIEMPTFDAFITTIIRIWGGFITTFIRIWGGFITTIIRIWGGGKPSEPGLPCH